MSDRIALLVGKIILAFGHLDQNIWTSIGNLRALCNRKRHLAGGKFTHPGEEQDERFKYRLKAIRRLLAALSDGDEKTLSEFDALGGRIARLADMRAKLAHGSSVADDHRIELHDHRDWINYDKERRKVVADPANLAAFMEQIEKIPTPGTSYSAAELATLAADIDQASLDLVVLVSAQFKRVARTRAAS